MTRSRKARRGFSLVEVMIASTLAALLFAAVLSTYNYLGRQLARLTSFQALENESRKTLAYFARDVRLAQSVKTGTNPSTTALTLVLPDGEVSYTFNATTGELRRQATFGVSPSLTFLRTSSCQCTSFALQYFSTSGGTAADQTTPATNIPLSIKQIQVSYGLESPSTWSETTRTRYSAVSARFLLQNRGLPDGT